MSFNFQPFMIDIETSTPMAGGPTYNYSGVNIMTKFYANGYPDEWYKQTTDGGFWAKFTSGPEILDVLPFGNNCVAIFPDSDDVTDIRISTDGGDTFKPVVDPGMSATYGFSYSVNSTALFLIAIGRSGASEIWRTVDGAKWNRLETFYGGIAEQFAFIDNPEIVVSDKGKVQKLNFNDGSLTEIGSMESNDFLSNTSRHISYYLQSGKNKIYLIMTARNIYGLTNLNDCYKMNNPDDIYLNFSNNSRGPYTITADENGWVLYNKGTNDSTHFGIRIVADAKTIKKEPNNSDLFYKDYSQVFYGINHELYLFDPWYQKIFVSYDNLKTLEKVGSFPSSTSVVYPLPVGVCDAGNYSYQNSINSMTYDTALIFPQTHFDYAPPPPPPPPGPEIPDFPRPDLPPKHTPNDTKPGDWILSPVKPGNSLIDAGNGFYTLYKIRNSELGKLSKYIYTAWDDIIAKITWTKSPTDVMVSIRAIPYDPDHKPDEEQLRFATNKPLIGVYGYIVTKQWTEISAGSIDIKPKYKNFLDFAPYTTVKIYLPFVGMVDVNTDDVMNQNVSVRYTIDNQNGAFRVFIEIGTRTLYTYTGKMGADIPLGSLDYSQMVQAFATSMSGLATTALTGPAGVLTGTLNTVASIANMSSNVQHSGQPAPDVSLTDFKKPFAMITRPNVILPDNYAHIHGKPCNRYLPLGGCEGFTQMSECDLDGFTCTQTEKEMIEEKLKTGVYMSKKVK